jgi:small GTP-binding protein
MALNKTFKNIIILGPSGVGKSSLIESLNGNLNSYSTSEAIRNMTTTQKAIIYNKSINIPVSYTEKGFFGNFTTETSISIKLLDTAGQSKYNDDKLSFLEYELDSGNIDGIVIVHDLSDINVASTSLEVAELYYQFLCQAQSKIPVLDIGNKSDSLNPHLRPKYRAHLETQKKRFTSFDWEETSARTGDNVQNAFEKLFRMIIGKSTLKIMKNKQTQQTKKRAREEIENDNELEPEKTQLRQSRQPTIFETMPKPKPFVSAFGLK